MKKILRIVCLFGFALAMPSIASAEALVITNRPVTQEVLVQAVKDCDKNILLESCPALVERVNKAFNIPPIADEKGLSEWLSRLEKRPCGDGSPCLYEDKAKFFVVSLAGAPVEQSQRDYWATKNECLAAQGAPFYVPTITSDKPLGKDEVILGHPTGGCFKIKLPDRLTNGFPEKGRGWVRGAQGVLVVYNTKTRKATRYAKCDNDIYEEVPFELPGVSPNPFEVQESVPVHAPDIAGQAKEAADDLAADLEEDRKRQDRRSVLSLKRTSGKVIWGGITAAVIAVAVCSTTDLCEGDRITQITNVGGTK